VNDAGTAAPPALVAENLILRLFEEIETTSILLQLALIAAAGVIAWTVAGLVRRRLATSRPVQSPDDALAFGARGLNRVLFPVMFWALLRIGRWALAHYASVRLLDIAVPLLSSLVVIRMAVYVLRHAFPQGSWLGRSERAVAWTMWTGVVLHITGVLGPLRAWLGTVRVTVGKAEVSALSLIEGTVLVLVTLIGAVWLGRLVEQRLMGLRAVDSNVRVVLSKVVKAAFIVVGMLIALSLVGIDITVLSVFGGALGVGLGLGLQKLAANYVSGFTILLDRSIKLGDLVTIDNRYGEVTRLTARYVVVRSLDGTENIIPNETVVTSTVVNHSYSDRRVRIDGTIQVAYDSDVRKALDLLVETARSHPRVVASPAPVALLRSFGDSGINLDFFVWITDPEAGRGNLQSELNLRILDAFRLHGIAIPFPQREVRLVSGVPEVRTGAEP
jgi:small-conductance mechanosensitive channel